MAEAIVLAVAGKLGSLAVGKLETMARDKFVKDYGLLVGVQAEAQKLQPKLTLIKPVLPDAELKQINNPSVKEWMESLKQIMYDAEDVLDEWHTRVSIFQSQITEASNLSRKLFSFLSSKYCSCFEPFLPLLLGDNFQLLSVRIDIARRMQGITRSLDDLCASMQQLNLISNDTHRDTYLPPRPLTSSMVDVSKVYGRDYDKKIIVSWLLSESSEQQKEVPVISIVGTGGFGKTTLAKLVLEDVDVVTAFGKNIWWVCVSEPFDRERVTREIVQQATDEEKAVVGAWQVLQKRLSESVRGKRFLLVLDDVWSKDPNDWDDLKIALAGGEQGSRIVITTRDSKVAQMMGCTRTHELKQLSDDGCWSLFRSIAFWGRSEDEIARLEGTGKELTKKCRGVPLAVKTLASHMRGERTIKDWKNVLNNEIWKVKHDTFFPALLLSYHALPSSLKQCFTYCSVFPKDTMMEKDELVKLWMAQGFLESDGRKELEMVGTEYFDNLAMASFFQDFRKDYVDGSIVRCKMHDLVHDFAQFLSGKESCVTGVHDQRTLIAAWQGQWDTSWMFNRLTCLRSLVLKYYQNKKLSSEVGSLLHLRYLDLSGSKKLEELPDTLCNLYNMQILILCHCGTLRKLPEEIGKLSNLRHLDIEDTNQLTCIPQSIGRLSKLRTLIKFIVSGATASKGCRIGELESLIHLSETLKLYGLRHVGSMDEAKRAKMLNKKNLSCLELTFGEDACFSGSDEDDDGMKRQESVLEGLQPDINLEELVIRGYQGSMFPCWMSSESLLPCLVDINLMDCKNCSELPPFGNFKYLERLYIESLNSVKHITSQFYGAGVEPSFPKLKELRLSHMEGLEGWEISFSNFEKVMPRLYFLEVNYCVKLMELPALGRLESLKEIRLSSLHSVKRVGTEFLGASCISGEEEVVFPNLRKLDFKDMSEWNEWDLPSVLCNLRNLFIWGCQKLKTLTLAATPRKFPSLETLYLYGLNGVKNVRADILGISYDNVVTTATEDGELSTTSASASPDPVLFPNLTKLYLEGFPEWEEDEGDEITTCTIFPVLQELEIINCEKLKVVPHYLFSRSLRHISLQSCPQLTDTQPCLPPRVEKLLLTGNVGVLSNSLLPIITNGNNNDGNSYPNLKSVKIWDSRHSSLPQGLNKFTSLQYLQINSCDILDLKPEEELRYFPMLQSVSIINCSTIEERYNREDWGNNLSRQSPFKASFEEQQCGICCINIITLEKVK